jgi:hypothetical protein
MKNYNTEDLKKLVEILEDMKNLIKDGETLCSGSEGDFTEFAESNGLDTETIKDVYDEHKDELQELFNDTHSVDLNGNRDKVLDALSDYLDGVHDSGFESFYDEDGLIRRDEIKQLKYSESFNIQMVDSLTFRVFDPFQQHFTGYINSNGWSNWTNE